MRQVMNQFFSFPLWPKRGGETEDSQVAVRTEQTRLIRCLLYGFVDYYGFEMGDRELEVRTATYVPGIDQSQQAKSVSQ